MTAARPDLRAADVDRLVAVARALGLDRLADRIVADTARRLRARRPRVAVVGRTGRGKSTVVNALVGRPVVPVDVLPTTRRAVVVGGDVPPGPHLVGDDGMAEPLDAARFEALVRGRDRAPGTVVVGPVSEDEARVEVVDTPGIGDEGAPDPAAVLAELPSADVLVLVLDATQAMARSEQAFLAAVVEALGGLRSSGAALVVVVTRTDLVPPKERAAVEAHVRQVVGDRATDGGVFFVDARAAAAGTDAHLRAAVIEIAVRHAAKLPDRTRADLDRTAALLEHHLAIERRVLSLTPETLAAELAALRAAKAGVDRDVAQARADLARSAEALAQRLERDVAEFRAELETSCRAVVDVASLQTLADRLPGSIHDACLLFLRRRGEQLAEELERLSRRARRTVGDGVARRLGEAHLALSAYGPTVYVDPPSLAIEAGTLAVGLAGTFLMYFGSVAAGMTMAVAGPLATVMLREQSVRKARARVREQLPAALDEAAAALARVLRAAVDRYRAALDEHLVLAGSDLIDHLEAQLEHAQRRLASATTDERRRALAAVEAHAQVLADLRRRWAGTGARAGARTRIEG